MAEPIMIMDTKIIIRNRFIVEYKMEKGDQEVYTKDRVITLSQSGLPITDPELGFQERGFSNPKMMDLMESPVKIMLEKAVLMYSNRYGASNFEHWMLDVLPKAWSASKYKGFDQLTFILLPGQFETLTREYLELLNVKPEKILLVGEGDIFVNEMHDFVSYYSYPFSVESSDFFIDLKKRLASKCSKVEQSNKRIFLGRAEVIKSGKGRFIANSQDLVELLNSEGFEFVNAGELSLIQKHELLSNTELILSEIGANCLNVLIAENVNNFIQIGHNKWKKTYYSDIFRILNPNSYSNCMFFDTLDPNHNPYESPAGVNVPWKVDIKSIKTELDRISSK